MPKSLQNTEARVLPEGAVAHIDDFMKNGSVDYSAEGIAGKHICGASGFIFDTEEAYLSHVSPVTGFTPADMEHHDALTDGMHSRASEAALKRGEARKEA